jgi:hypothetical protein
MNVPPRLLLAAALLACCHDPTAAPATRPSAPAARPAAPATPPTTPAPATAPGTAAAATAPAVWEALAPEARQQLAASPLTVLLLPSPELARSAVITTGERWYAASYHRDEHGISIHATDVVHENVAGAAPPPARDRVRGVPALVQVNEGIQSVAWEEHGVHYVVEVECERPFEDVRCTSDAYVRSLAESLVAVRGAR